MKAVMDHIQQGFREEARNLKGRNFMNIAFRFQPYWLCRLFLALLVMLSCITVLTEPQSLIAITLAASGPAGRLVVMLLLAFSMIALLDVFINDLLPEKWAVHWTRNIRHLIYLGMALILTALAGVVSVYNPFTPLLPLTYLLYAAFAAATAYLDLFARKRIIQ